MQESRYTAETRKFTLGDKAAAIEVLLTRGDLKVLLGSPRPPKVVKNSLCIHSKTTISSSKSNCY
jgi:hypothetical protein